MPHYDLLIKPEWLIPIVPEGKVLERHALAVTDGCIQAILPDTAAVEAREVIDLPGHALLPGLVNAHTHAGLSLFRGLADDLPLMEWLNEHIWPTEARVVSDHFVRDGTRLAAAEMLRGGTTCFNDMYFFPDEAGRASEELGIRAVLGLIVIDFPTVWAKDANEYLEKATEVHEQFRNSPLIETIFAPHAPYTVSDKPLTRIRTMADELDIPIHMHVHETAQELEDAIAKDGRRPLRRLDELGMLSNRLLAVHMTQLLPEEIERIAECGVHVLHCPESNLKLASGFCPVHALDQAGVNIAFGTDSAASNNDLDMFGEMRTAALLAKGVAGDAGALPGARTLTMATMGGAKALGLDRRIGSLQAGKTADVIAVDLSGLEAQPVYDPISHLVYATHRSQVTNVWVGGERVLRDGQLTRADEHEIAANAHQWRERIR